MRFQKHLNEAKKALDIDIYQFNKLLKRDCKKYLKHVNMPGNHPLYRGMRADGVIGVADTRSDRKSSYFGHGMPIPKAFNAWLQKNGHLRRDKNVVIASGSRAQAGGFGLGGSVYMIFPINMGKYTWVAAKDAHLSDEKTGWKGGTAITSKFYDGDEDADPLSSIVDMDAYKQMKKPFDKYFFTNKGFDAVGQEGFEVWLECKQYYYADARRFKWHKGQLVEK